jgi:diguanylate cyclase (GGDEF)-like protein
MSFRRRLTLFFVILVIVPMIAVTAVLFRLISTNETGKANANLAARAHVAANVYSQSATDPSTVAAATRIARDPALGAALMSGNTAAANARAQALLGTGGVIRIALARGAATTFDVGNATAVAPLYQRLVGTSGQSLGRLAVSPTSAAEYAHEVQSLTGLEVMVSSGPEVLTSTLPAASRVALPPPGVADDVTVAGVDYRAVTLSATGFPAGPPLHITVLGALAPIQPDATDSRVVAGILIGIFFVIAVGFAILVSRSLQAQIEGFLDAARRLGGGDFSAQVPIVGHDEFAELGDEFNKMSRQLEERLQENREQRERLENSLRRIGDTFASNLDRNGLLEIMLRTAVDGVGAEGGRASIRIGGGEMEEQVRVGSLNGAEPALAAVETGVLEAGAPTQIDLDGVSALGHPLAAQQRVIGLLSVARADRPFSEAERNLFDYLAGQASVSIENIDLHERVQRQAVTDELTGLYNHRRFHEAIATEVERAKRFDQDLGLVMLDIDDFKQVNDRFGHQQGDIVLRDVARIVQGFSRDIDAPARYGGEELALLLPGTNLDGAHHLAERVREGIEDLRFTVSDQADGLKVTASVGVAAISSDHDMGPRELIAAADAALYEAKRSGKNRTVRAR